MHMARNANENASVPICPCSTPEPFQTQRYMKSTNPTIVYMKFDVLTGPFPAKGRFYWGNAPQALFDGHERKTLKNTYMVV
jgi:hypothetical protein